MVSLPRMDFSSFDVSLLRWAVPPIIGAVIGYVTNVIAIRMLFRPLTEKRFLGIRIPLTPGIIPRQRHSLSQSIGVMVSRDLITEDAVRNQLSSPAFKETVHSRLKALLRTLLYSPTGSLPQRLRLPDIGVEERLEHREEGGGEEEDTTQSLVTEILSDFLSTEGFVSSIERTVGYAVESLCRRPLGSLIGERGDKVISFLNADRLRRLREPLKLNLRLWLREQVRGSRRFSAILTPQVIEGLGQVLDHLYPSLFEAFLGYLREPKVHRQLELRGKVILRRILDKLSSFQRFFVLAGQYDRTLDERMDVVVDDVLLQLEKAGTDYETRRRLIDTIKRWLGRIAQMSAGDFMSAWRGDMIEDATKAFDSIFDGLVSERGETFLRQSIGAFLSRFSDEELGTLIYRITGLQIEELAEFGATWIVGSVFGGGEAAAEKGRPAVWNLIRSLADEISEEGRKSIAEIVGLTDSDRERLELQISRLFIRVLNEQVPAILRSVDVQTLVVQKIDSLDIIKVENLILTVIKSHLTWISFFGGVLGFLIGSLQVLSFLLSGS